MLVELSSEEFGIISSGLNEFEASWKSVCDTRPNDLNSRDELQKIESLKTRINKLHNISKLLSLCS